MGQSLGLYMGQCIGLYMGLPIGLTMGQSIGWLWWLWGSLYSPLWGSP